MRTLYVLTGEARQEPSWTKSEVIGVLLSGFADGLAGYCYYYM